MATTRRHVILFFFLFILYIAYLIWFTKSTGECAHFNLKFFFFFPNSANGNNFFNDGGVPCEC